MIKIAELLTRYCETVLMTSTSDPTVKRYVLTRMVGNPIPIYAGDVISIVSRDGTTRKFQANEPSNCCSVKV